MSDNGKPIIRFQTFRIRPDTTLKKLKDSCFEFWDLKDRDYDFQLRFVDNNNDVFKIEDEDNSNGKEILIDAFFKTKTNIKKAKFALVNSKYKFYNEDIKAIQESQENKKKTKIQSLSLGNSALTAFLQRFVGLSSNIFKRLIKIQHDRTKVRKKEEKKVSYLFSITSQIFYGLLFALFFAFTLVSLMQMRPPDKSYIMQESIKRLFIPKKDGFLTLDDVREDFLDKLDFLFISSTSEFSNFQNNAVKFTIYKTKKTNCRDFFTKYNKTVNCYYPLYSDDVADTQIDESYSYISQSKCIGI